MRRVVDWTSGSCNILLLQMLSGFTVIAVTEFLARIVLAVALLPGAITRQIQVLAARVRSAPIRVPIYMFVSVGRKNKG